MYIRIIIRKKVHGTMDIGIQHIDLNVSSKMLREEKKG